jgi:GTPase
MRARIPGRRQRSFYDQVRILAAAGNGGRGKVSFFRDNRVEMGPPEGGNGGRGGSIIVRACDQTSDLRMPTRNFRAEHGANGGTAQCHGRNGKPTILRVPCGTVVHRLGQPTSTQTSRMQPSDATKVLLAELLNDGDEVVTAKGGEGGRGNMALKSDKMQGVAQAEEGGSGQVRALPLSLHSPWLYPLRPLLTARMLALPR